VPEDILTLKLGPFELLGLAAFGIVLGGWIKRRLPALDRLNIPTSIVGGLVYAVLALLLRDRVLNFDLDTTIRDVLMVAFFTTIGMNASLRLLWIGGLQVVIFLGAAVVGLILQIAWGVGAATLFGLDPLIGIIPGAVALTGGPATALAFGSVFEELGVASATTLGVGAAMFGIVIGGLVGGYVGGHLIQRNKIEPAVVRDNPEVSLTPSAQDDESSWFGNALMLCLAMGLGVLLNRPFTEMGLTFPVYIGPMICAAILRNLDEARGGKRISMAKMDQMGVVALELFIVMALLSLRLWEIANLALPVFIILCGQIAILVAVCWLLVFRLMGRDYQAAVMSTGYFGFMMGTTANAMACMNELVRTHGPAPRAFFVVTIVGALFIDFVNALLITLTINLLR
jgi:ESS family glutamate:Na+ symporter